MHESKNAEALRESLSGLFIYFRHFWMHLTSFRCLSWSQSGSCRTMNLKTSLKYLILWVWSKVMSYL